MTKSIKSVVVLFVSGFLVSPCTAQVQIVVHPKETLTAAENMAYKNAREKMYSESVEKIRKYKEDVLMYKAAIEEVERNIYKGLTTISDGIKEAKAGVWAMKKMVAIYRNLQEADQLSLTIKGEKYTPPSTDGPPPVGPPPGGGTGPVLAGLVASSSNVAGDGAAALGLGNIGDVLVALPERAGALMIHYRFKKVIITRFMGLTTYITSFLSYKGNDVKDMMSNVVRERFLFNIYKELCVIEAITNSYLYALKTCKLQREIEGIVPIQLYINRDKQAIQSIIQKLKF